MTKKTMLQQIRSLAHAAINSDDDQEQFGILMRIIELTETNPPFAVGEYYTSKTGIIFKITSKTAKEEIIAVKSLVDGEIIDGMIDTTEIMFRNSKPATADQIATFRRAEQFAAKGRKLDEFRAGDLVNCKSLAYDNGYYTGDLVISRINKQGLTGRTDENLFYTYALPNFKKIALIQTAEELQEVADDSV